MDKTSTLTLRINPELKSNAEAILSRLGIPMSTAIDMYLTQIVLTNAIPFSIALPKPPKEIDISQLTNSELYDIVLERYNNFNTENSLDAKEAFKDFWEKRKK